MKLILKLIFKIITTLILAFVILLIAGFIYLVATEYSPNEIEAIAAPSGQGSVAMGDTLTLVSFNTGFASLGENSDFFMDGGKMVRAASAMDVTNAMEGVVETLKLLDADIYLLQEVDIDSKRAYGINQADYYSAQLDMPSAFALNYSAKFVPYPLHDMIGRVNSGLATYTAIGVSSAYRIQLPVPFKWPLRVFNLKRCLLVARIPVENSDRELVIINLHLEAYDDGEGKAEQTKLLYSILEEERANGNYVIAGGDFNQTFPGAYLYDVLNSDNWTPGTIDPSLPQGYRFAFDDSLPTCRLLDKPYAGNDAPQYYIIDGFIVSDNVTVELVQTVDAGFVDSDHQPIRLVIKLSE